jgi:CHASE2 domain-containing sensor protein
MYEWIIIFYALMVEAIAITWPSSEFQERLLNLPKLLWLKITLHLILITLALSYMVFSFLWMLSPVPTIRVLGLTIVTISLAAFIHQTLLEGGNLLFKRLDGAICFTCLVLIAYARTKGW